jgi:hypothetical protein
MALKVAISNSEKQNQQEVFQIAQALYNVISECSRT